MYLAIDFLSLVTGKGLIAFVISRSSRVRTLISPVRVRISVPWASTKSPKSKSDLNRL